MSVKINLHKKLMNIVNKLQITNIYLAHFIKSKLIKNVFQSHTKIQQARPYKQRMV